jgi:hypothetical protein
MFENLKSLLQRGDNAIPVAPAPKPLAAVAAPVAPITAAPERADDPYADLKRFSVVGGTPRAIPAPTVDAPVEEGVVLPVQPPTTEELDAIMKQVIAEKTFGEDLAEEDWARPVLESEEADETLPQHSNARIRFLALTFERNRPDLTERRIRVDKMRALHANPVPTYSPYKKADTNPQSYILKA